MRTSRFRRRGRFSRSADFDDDLDDYDDDRFIDDDLDSSDFNKDRMVRGLARDIREKIRDL